MFARTSPGLRLRPGSFPSTRHPRNSADRASSRSRTVLGLSRPIAARSVVSREQGLPVGVKTFEFNSGDRRHRPNRSQRGRLKAEFEKLHGRLPKEGVIGHINGNRSDGRIENLHCSDTFREEQKLHHQLIQFVTEMVDSGLLKFNKSLEKYYVDNPWLINMLSRQAQAAA